MMKKVLFTALCLFAISFTAAYAQSEAAPKNTTAAGASTARTKGVGKGSPLLQREAGPGNAAPAPAPVESAPASGVKISPTPAAAPNQSLAPTKVAGDARSTAPVAPSTGKEANKE